MPGSIALILSKVGGPPFLGSVGYINDAIAPILARNRWHVRSFLLPQPQQTQEGMLPLALTAQMSALNGSTRPDVALFDAGAVAARGPTHGWAARNMLLYHGLAYGAGSWMTSPDINLHCANSPYLESSLRAIFAFPNWQARSCLNAQGLGSLMNIPLPVPCVEHPDGHPGFSYGGDLPAHINRALDGNMIWAHALQPGKQDWFATLAILHWLNALSSAAHHPRIKLFVPEGSLRRDLRAALDSMLPTGQTCNDYFFEVPLLNQRALFQLVRACRFGLAYNQFPEPFGFYALESVHNGCPVYTNGVGNNRFLLPPGHGINVYETFAMAPTHSGERDAAAYRSVAEQILADLRRADEIRSECARGAAVIRKRWSAAEFERGMLSALDRLTNPVPFAPPAFDDLQVQLSPFMRGLDRHGGVCLNDYASVTLGPSAIAATNRLLGRTCRDLASAEMDQIETTHHLFACGILTLVSASATPAVGTVT